MNCLAVRATDTVEKDRFVKVYTCMTCVSQLHAYTCAAMHIYDCKYHFKMIMNYCN